MDPKGVRPPPEGMGVPSMMRQMMEKMCCAGESSPAARCQEMMPSMGKTAGMPDYPTPEVRKLFEEWARRVETEVLATLKARGPLDLATLAGALRMSPESALCILGKLVREGKLTIDSIRAAGGADTTA